MKRIGYFCTATLLALAVGGLVASCQPAQPDQSGIEDKLEEIDKRLENIESAVKQGAAARRPRRRRRPRGPDPSKVYSVPVKGAPFKGTENAKVTVVKAFEFACPFCERARSTMDQILEEYSDDVRIVYKHYIVHPSAATVPAQASCAAAQQGKFAEMEDLIWDKGFKAGRDLGKDKMEALAKEVGLDMNRFKADMEGTCKELVQKDHQQMKKVGVTGTPGFFINGRFLRGAQPFPAFKKIIDEELAKANERISEGTPAEKYYEEWIVKKGEKSI